jgi:hypothetical protein
MSILIQDTARNNLASWTVSAVKAKAAVGAVISPFSSPVSKTSYKPDITKLVDRIRKSGGQVWFDPTTHALQMPQAGDFRYYKEWNLWGGSPNDLLSEDSQRDHIRRVFDIQRSMSAPLLAPTVLLHSAQSQTSLRAISMAQIAREEASGEPVWISIVGDANFWAAGGELDGHIGALDQTEPDGWFVTVTRAQGVVPVPVNAEEISGMMRTVYALSQNAPVTVGHGDLAGLPAIAAGASLLGTGWDIRQRVCAYTDYAARVSSDSGGQWYQRPTLEVLLGGMTYNEYQVLRNQNRLLAERLTQGQFRTGPENAFRHHASVLATVVDELNALSGEARVQALRARYDAAYAEWPQVQRLSGCSTSRDHWIKGMVHGMDQFMASEGW